MSEEQRAELLEILIQTWGRAMSADEALELVEDIVYDVRAKAMRTVDPLRGAAILENEQRMA